MNANRKDSTYESASIANSPIVVEEIALSRCGE